MNEYENKLAIAILSARGEPKVLEYVKTHMVSRDPYELKILFEDNSKMTINLNHVFSYVVVEVEEE